MLDTCDGGGGGASSGWIYIPLLLLYTTDLTCYDNDATTYSAFFS